MRILNVKNKSRVIVIFINIQYLFVKNFMMNIQHEHPTKIKRQRLKECYDFIESYNEKQI